MSIGYKFEKSFRDITRKSRKECGDEVEKIHQLGHRYLKICRSVVKSKNIEDRLPNFENSLVYTCFLELTRISIHIFFLSLNGLYRNAFDDIRYVLESIVQALYLDLRHPKIDIKTKIEILKEVEDKREYHAVRLIDDLEIDHKDTLKKEYKKLSRIVHPSHKQIVATLRDFTEEGGIPATMDCEEISKIYDSMRIMYDIIFFLFIARFPEVEKTLQKNSDFIKLIKTYDLTLLSRAFKVRL